MNATKILWVQALLVCAAVLVFIWTATEWTAWQLAFQPQLGRPWFMLFGWPIYQPPAFFWWWFAYDAYAHEIFVTGGFIAGAGGVAAFTVAVAMSVWRAREAKKVTTYGSARWAEAREIRTAGLLRPDGVLLGRWRGAYLRHHGPEHVLCFAPTRSGKGVGLVVPTLLTWPGSAIVHDIKGENWGLTAGWRARFGSVLLFDPTNTKSAAYNPLLEVRRGEWEVRDVQNIADVLVDPEGALEKRNHWEKTSHSLLVGTILHVLYAERDKTLAGVANFLSDPKRSIETTLRAMVAPAASDTEDPANAGIRREPELPEHEEIVPEPAKPVHEFEPADEEPDDEVQRRRHQLREIVPLADSTIYEMEQRGEFPRRFALSPRCVVWDLAEVEAWMAARRSAPIARAQPPDVKQRRSRPVREPGRVQAAASKAG